MALYQWAKEAGIDVLIRGDWGVLSKEEKAIEMVHTPYIIESNDTGMDFSRYAILTVSKNYVKTEISVALSCEICIVLPASD